MLSLDVYANSHRLSPSSPPHLTCSSASNAVTSLFSAEVTYLTGDDWPKECIRVSLGQGNKFSFIVWLCYFLFDSNASVASAQLKASLLDANYSISPLVKAIKIFNLRSFPNKQNSPENRCTIKYSKINTVYALSIRMGSTYYSIFSESFCFVTENRKSDPFYKRIQKNWYIFFRIQSKYTGMPIRFFCFQYLESAVGCISISSESIRSGSRVLMTKN